MVALPLSSSMRKVRALGDGESCALVLLDSREIYGKDGVGESLRALVTRHMGDEGVPPTFDAVLQKLDGLEEWEPWEEGRREGEEELTAWRYLTLSEVTTLLPFLGMVAEREARWLVNSRDQGPAPALGVAA